MQRFLGTGNSKNTKKIRLKHIFFKVAADGNLVEAVLEAVDLEVAAATEVYIITFNHNNFITTVRLVD